MLNPEAKSSDSASGQQVATAAGGSVRAPMLQVAAAAGAGRGEPSVAQAVGQPPVQRKRGRPRKVPGSAEETEARPEFVPETDLQSADACPGAMEWSEGSEDQGGELLRRSGRRKRQTAMKLRTLEKFSYTMEALNDCTDPVLFRGQTMDMELAQVAAMQVTAAESELGPGLEKCYLSRICGHSEPMHAAPAVPDQATQVSVPAADAVPDLAVRPALSDNALLGSISAPVPALADNAVLGSGPGAVPAQSSHVPGSAAMSVPVRVFSLLLEDTELFQSLDMVD